MNSIRFSGLASGMDTQSIVESMMKAERMPLDRLNQKKQTLEWQRDDYREMNKLLKEFDTYIFDNVYRQSKMLSKSVTTSNSGLVSATASSSAANMAYTISDVKLATAASRISGTISGNKLDPTKSLWSQRNNFSESIGEWQQEKVEQEFTVPEKSNGKFRLSKGAITNDPSKVTISITNDQGDSVKTFNSSDIEIGTIPENKDPGKVYIDDNTGEIVFGDTLAAGHKIKVGYESNYLEFGIKTYDQKGDEQIRYFKFDGTTSLNSMFTKLNQANAGVNFFYDSYKDTIVATRTETGKLASKDNPEGTQMEFVNIKRNDQGEIIETATTESAFFKDVLGLADNLEVKGTNATFKINGLETSRPSNTFTISDVTFTLNKNSDVGESSTVGIKNNTDESVKVIKEFIQKYNELIDKVNGKLNEERYRSFTPLSDEQKVAMKDKEVELWEEKAKSGLLRRDSMLSSGLEQMRLDLYSEVIANDQTLTDKNYNQLAEIGITTSKNYLERGKLEINDDKLKAALEDNPEAVFQLFMADGSSTDTSQMGLARRLRKTIAGTMQKIEEKAGNVFKTEDNYSLGKNLKKLKEDISKLEDRLKIKEQRYWNQFNSMEKMMQQMNNQSNYLLSQLGIMQQQ